MRLLRAFLIGSDENIEQRNMIWNMIGSFLYAFASMALTIAVIQIVGEDQGGDFTFAFTTFGQHMFMVAYFGIRPFHITDTRQRYTFGEYLRLRLLTCGAALIFGLFYVTAHGGVYTRQKAMTVFLMVCYKVIDGFADAYEAEFQREGRLYLTGKSNTYRTLLSVICFMGSLVATKNLVFSCGVAVAAQAAGVLLFDLSVIGHISGVDWRVRKQKIWWLFRDNFLLFLSVLIDFYVFSAAKYAVDSNMASRDMSVFGAIFMPTSFINLVAGFVIRPYLTKLSGSWEKQEFKSFLGVVRQLAAIIAGLTVFAVGAAWFLGIPVLGILYPKISYALADCRWALIMIILGGAGNAYVNLFYYALVIMQKQPYIFVGYVVAGVLAVCLSSPFVRAAGILGGALSYLLLMIALAVCFGVTAAVFYRGEQKRRGEEHL